MAHFDKKTGTAVEVISMGTDVTFKVGKSTNTVPAHVFSDKYRAGKPYEIAAGKFDYPEGYGKPVVTEEEPATEDA